MVERIEGTNRNDNILGSSADEAIFGRGGRDTLSGGSGSDRVFGGRGNDTIFISNGRDYLFGRPGNDAYIVDPVFQVTRYHIVETETGELDTVTINTPHIQLYDSHKH